MAIYFIARPKVDIEDMNDHSPAAIVVKNLVFDYPAHRALHDVSFSVARGSVTALVGPNGAGKTTLMSCLAALARPLSGQIEVDGVNMLRDPREGHRRIRLTLNTTNPHIARKQHHTGALTLVLAHSAATSYRYSSTLQFAPAR